MKGSTKVLRMSKDGRTRITQTQLGQTVDVLGANDKWVTMASENNGDPIRDWFKFYSGECHTLADFPFTIWVNEYGTVSVSDSGEHGHRASTRILGDYETRDQAEYFAKAIQDLFAEHCVGEIEHAFTVLGSARS